MINLKQNKKKLMEIIIYYKNLKNSKNNFNQIIKNLYMKIKKNLKIYMNFMKFT